MHPLLATAPIDGAVLGIPMLALSIAGLIITLFWIFFPIVVWGKMNTMLKHLRAIEAAAEEMAKNTRPAGAPAKPVSSVRYSMPKPGE